MEDKTSMKRKSTTAEVPRIGEPAWHYTAYTVESKDNGQVLLEMAECLTPQTYKDASENEDDIFSLAIRNMDREQKIAIMEGIERVGDALLINVDGARTNICRPYDEVPEEVHGVRYVITWNPASSTTAGKVLFVREEVKEEFEKGISCGYTQEQIIQLVGENLADVVKFSARMNSTVGALRRLSNTGLQDIGAYVLLEKPKDQDGQFLMDLDELSGKTAYQMRGFSGAIKGMGMNNRKEFSREIRWAERKHVPHMIIGNPNNIRILCNLNAYKLPVSVPPLDGCCFVMAECHDNDSVITERFTQKLAHYVPREILDRRMREYIVERIDYIMKPHNGAYDMSCYGGLSYGLTCRLFDDFVKTIGADDEDGTEKFAYRIGATYSKILQAGRRCKTVREAGYLCVDAPHLPSGQMILRRPPDASLGEWFIVYNRPGVYRNVYDKIIMLPPREDGLLIAETMGGADFDGDGVCAIYDTEIVQALIDSGYKSLKISVVVPKSDITVESYRHTMCRIAATNKWNVGRIINLTNNLMFAPEGKLRQIFKGRDVINREYLKVSLDALDASAINEIWGWLKSGFDINDPKGVVKIKLLVGVIARYCSEVEVGFCKTGTHAPVEILDWLSEKIDLMRKISGGFIPKARQYYIDYRALQVSAKAEFMARTTNYEWWMPGYEQTDRINSYISLWSKAHRDADSDDKRLWRTACENTLRTSTNKELVKYAVSSVCDIQTNLQHILFVDESLEATGLFEITDKDYSDKGLYCISISGQNKDRINNNGGKTPLTVGRAIRIAGKTKKYVSYKTAPTALTEEMNDIISLSPPDNGIYKILAIYQGSSKPEKPGAVIMVIEPYVRPERIENENQ